MPNTIESQNKLTTTASTDDKAVEQHKSNLDAPDIDAAKEAASQLLPRIVINGHGDVVTHAQHLEDVSNER